MEAKDWSADIVFMFGLQALLRTSFKVTRPVKKNSFVIVHFFRKKHVRFE